MAKLRAIAQHNAKDWKNRSSKAFIRTLETGCKLIEPRSILSDSLLLVVRIGSMSGSGKIFIAVGRHEPK